MKPTLWLWPALLMGCTTEPDFATIAPPLGFVDGCEVVSLQGSNLGTEAQAFVGGPVVEEVEIPLTPAEFDPELPDYAQDVGFEYFGRMPPSPRIDEGGGFQDITMVVDGIEMMIMHAFYYRPCYDSLVVEDYTVPETAASGDTFSFFGCNLDDQVEMVIFDDTEAEVAREPLTGDPLCPTADVTGTVPDLAAGDYTVQLIHSDGTAFAPVCETIKGKTTTTGGKQKKTETEVCRGLPFTVEGA